MNAILVKKPHNAKKRPFLKKKAKKMPLKSPRSPVKKKISIYHPKIMGRPPKYKTVEELEKLIDKYFLSCWEQKIDMFGNPIFMKDKKGKKTNKKVMIQKEPYTITDLAIALGTTRETLIDYEKKDDFSDTIKRAKEMCQGYAERQLFIGKNPTGAIFNLKNNYGFKDKTEQEHSGNLTWVEQPPK